MPAVILSFDGFRLNCTVSLVGSTIWRIFILHRGTCIEPTQVAWILR